MEVITGGGAFTRQNIAAINSNFAQLFAGLTPGNIIYCDPSTSNLTQPADGSLAYPYQDIVSAFGAARSGENDVIVLVGNGLSTGSARITSNLAWNKDAVHLLGVAPPSLFSQRARIAPASAATAFANFVTVSGSGCYFANVQFYQGFDTGTTSAICATVTGSRNVFKNCQFAGMMDAASAQNAGSRSLKVSGQENVFTECVIGGDTVARTQANASLELAGATARNVFVDCIFPFFGSAAGVLGILGTGAGCVDRENYFKGCLFTNAIGSTSTTMTALVSFTSASPGGVLVFDAACGCIGITKLGDTNGLANSYILGAAPSAAAGLLGVNPS